MKEDFLHFVWKFGKYDAGQLKTTTGDAVQVIRPGTHNFNSGPDFLNCELIIDGMRWAGNVELHLRSSLWYQHKHHKDTSFDSVLLHVVWEHDMEVDRAGGDYLPTIELKYLVPAQVLDNYRRLFKVKNTWLNCETDIGYIAKLKWDLWLERLYLERLEDKCRLIEKELEITRGDWEVVTFKSLARAFGYQVNKDSFSSMAGSFSFSTLRKLSPDQFQLEALFMGQLGLLEGHSTEPYFHELKEAHEYMTKKYRLDTSNVVRPKFFRLRPVNFPTIRVSQLASLYARSPYVFSGFLRISNLEEVYKLFEVSASPFWDSHYTFSKTSDSVPKKLSSSLIDRIITNCLIPLRFAFGKYSGRQDEQWLIEIAQNINAEQNSILKGFKRIGKPPNNALESQALLQLNNEYCVRNRCLKCQVGHAILNGNPNS